MNFKILITTFFILIIIIIQGYEPNSIKIEITYIVFALYLLVIQEIYKLNKLLFYCSSYIIFSYTITLLSCILIENGSYMIEIQQFGSRSGVTNRMALFCIILFITMYIGFSVLPTFTAPNRVETEKSLSLIKGFYLIYAVGLGVLIFILIKYGSPLFLQVNRQVYWKDIAPIYTGYLISLFQQVSILNGFLYRQYKLKSIRNLFFIFVIVQILNGIKFSGIVVSVFYFMLPFYLLPRNTKKITFANTKKMLIIVGLILSLSIVVYINYILLEGSVEEANFILESRLSLEGQLWWAIDERLSLLPEQPSEVLGYLKEHVLGVNGEKTEPNYSVGQIYLMTETANPDIVNVYVSKGSKFTMGYPMIYLLGTGYFLGFFIQCLVGFIIGIILKLAVNLVRRKNLLGMVIAAKTIFIIFLVLTDGDIQYAFSSIFVVYLVLLITLNYNAYFTYKS